MTTQRKHHIIHYQRGIVGHVDHDGLRYVAKVGANNDWACYALDLERLREGLTEPGHEPSDDEIDTHIARFGDKQFVDVATPLFVVLNPERYRP